MPGTVSQQKGPAVSGGIVLHGNQQLPHWNHGLGRRLDSEITSSLHITRDGLIDLNPAYSIRLKTSFHYNPGSGTILRISNPKYSLKLVFTGSPGSDFVVFRTIMNDRPTGLEFKLPKSEVFEGKEHTLRIDVNESVGEVLFNLNNSAKTWSTSPFATNEGSEIFFGSSPGDATSASMMISDLQIFIGGELKHRYSFMEMDGNIAYDETGDLDAHAKNHIWNINRHYFWTVHDSMVFKKSVYQGIFNDPYNNRFGVLTNEGIEYYSFKDGSTTLTKYPEPDRTRYGMYAYPNQDLVVGYSSYWPDNEAVTYDFKNGKGTGKLTVDTKEGHHYGGRVFVDTRTGSVNIFGGYGWYKTRNDLIRFNPTTRKWNELKTTGDFIAPRHSFAILPSKERDVYYILGGVGNRSGKQADGFTNLWDFYRFNLDSLSFTKMYEWGRKEDYHANFSAVWADQAQNTIYVALRPYGWDEGRAKWMGRINFSDTVLTVVGDTLKTGGFYPADGELVIDHETSRLFSVWVFEYDSTVTVRVVSIKTPLLSDIEYKQLYSSSPNVVRMNRSSFWSQWSIPLAALLLLPLASIYIRRYRKRKKGVATSNVDKPVIGELRVERRQDINFVTLFGGLGILDSNGVDIAGKLSPKQVDVLSFIAFHSFCDKNRKGAELSRLESAIWPGSPPESLKNTRNVTLSKIRAILKDFEGVSLTVNKNSVTMLIDEKYRNEIEEYFLLKQHFSDSENILDGEAMNDFIRIVRKGKFLGERSEEWIEELRSGVEDEIVEIILLYLKRIFSEGKLEKCVEIVDAVSIHEPLNEELLGIKLRSLYNLGRHSIALEIFNSHCKEYEAIFGETCRTTLNDLLRG